MFDWKLIRKIAREVRLWAEKIQQNDPEDIYPKDLCGLCAIATAKLHMQLKKNKIKSTIVYGDHHVFLVVDDFVVDVTATQFPNTLRGFGFFRAPKILIVSWKKLQVSKRRGEISPWTDTVRFNSVNKLAKWQRKEDWPEEQLVQ
jgi:hypothetical protein